MAQSSFTVIRRNLLAMPIGVLAHQVNCQGKMGKGLALAIRDKWPRVHDEYLRKHSAAGWRLGDVQTIQVGPQLWVANLAGQEYYGRTPGVVYTSYPDLARALRVAGDYAVARKVPLYVPHGIGCGLAGGDWSKVVEFLPSGTIVCQL